MGGKAVVVPIAILILSLFYTVYFVKGPVQVPLLFATAVANIAPGQDVEIRLEYVEKIRYDAGRFRREGVPAWDPRCGSDGEPAQPSLLPSLRRSVPFFIC